MTEDTIFSLWDFYPASDTPERDENIDMNMNTPGR